MICKENMYLGLKKRSLHENKANCILFGGVQYVVVVLKSLNLHLYVYTVYM